MQLCHTLLPEEAPSDGAVDHVLRGAVQCLLQGRHSTWPRFHLCQLLVQHRNVLLSNGHRERGPVQLRLKWLQHMITCRVEICTASTSQCSACVGKRGTHGVVCEPPATTMHSLSMQVWNLAWRLFVEDIVVPFRIRLYTVLGAAAQVYLSSQVCSPWTPRQSGAAHGPHPGAQGRSGRSADACRSAMCGSRPCSCCDFDGSNAPEAGHAQSKRQSPEVGRLCCVLPICMVWCRVKRGA